VYTSGGRHCLHRALYAGARLAVLVALCLAAGCQGTGNAPADGSSSTVDTVAPAAPPAPASAPGEQWTVIADESLLVARVYRAGRLARMGHDHLIATRALHGTLTLAPVLADSQVEIRFAKSDLLIDDAALRARAGPPFDTEVPAEAIEGTRANLLGPRLLDADQYPMLTVRATAMQGTLAQLLVHASVSVLDRAYPVSFPVAVTIDSNRLVASGSTRITHADIGLEPFSVLLGALRVDETIELDYSIVAEIVE
jgi:hypothetical protein